MGALELTTPQEIDWLKKSSVPGFHQKIVSVNSDEILELDVTLELLEVRLIKLHLSTDFFTTYQWKADPKMYGLDMSHIYDSRHLQSLHL